MQHKFGNITIITTDATVNHEEAKVEIFDNNSGRLICTLLASNFPRPEVGGELYPFIQFELLEPDQKNITVSDEKKLETKSSDEDPFGLYHRRFKQP